MKPTIPGSPDSSAPTDDRADGIAPTLAGHDADSQSPQERGGKPVGLALSLALHVAAALILLLFADPPKPFGVAGEDAMDVVLVSPGMRFPPRQGERGATPPSPSPAEATPDEPTAPAPPIVPEQTVPAEATAEPRMSVPPPSPSGKATDRLTQAPSRQREMVEARTLYTSRLRDTALGRASLADLALADPEEQIFSCVPTRRWSSCGANTPTGDSTMPSRKLVRRPRCRDSRWRQREPPSRPRPLVRPLVPLRSRERPDGCDSVSYLLGAEITRPERDDLDLPTGGPVH